MKKLEDETLVLQSKDGNEEAIEVLFSRYKPFLKKIIRGYFLLGADEEDLMQEAMIGLYKAILSYDEDKQVSFKTFANLCVKRSVLDAMKKSNAKKHSVLNNSVSLSAISVFEDAEEYMLFSSIKETLLDEQMMEDEKLDEIFELIKKNLSKLEFEVLDEYLKGHTYAFISEKLGISTKSVDNALNRIKAKLKFLQN